MRDAVVALTPTPGLTAGACVALSVPRASVYRQRARLARPSAVHRPRPSPRRALAIAERQTVLDLLRAPRFVDQAPAEVYASLLDEGVYHCSIRTMYRILAANQEVRERRAQLRHPVYKKPELLARAPNEVWSWDITKLMGPAKWTYFYLYVIIDIFSRRVVGWCVADRESATLFKALFDDAVAKHPAPPGQLTLHADRGGPMRAKATALLLADLGVTQSHSRPHTSNDNPFSESHFKTMKYQPQFPQRFGCIQDAKAFCRSFFDWYNQDHHHAGIGLMTPDQVHYGQADEIHTARQNTLDAAFDRNPERFVRKEPEPPAKPTATWINPPSDDRQNPRKDGRAREADMAFAEASAASRHRTLGGKRRLGWKALSRPSAAEGGGRRPAFTGLAAQPNSATEVDGWLLRDRFPRHSRRVCLAGNTTAEN
jgi:transposase InsO family protein